ncbi:YrdB family protein [Ktedonospora formicarum]|uniref:DUF2568 domain-containing protein n=1 Tax=Ktedonospora formicarum TaxID=2778364 RepID=A0A8J3MVY5_9CHLR|nr:YrdB family protein [Ktedonospora formicarum]GHO48133.1 hypothetical protein KSX_62960 [Ktedonospora formicarum]
MAIIKNSNLALAFFLELGVLVAWGYWGFVVGPNLPFKLLFGIGMPVLAIVVWALFGAPTAQWHLNGIWRIVLGIIFFGSAALALYLAKQPAWGLAFALVFVLNWGLGYAFGQQY